MKKTTHSATDHRHSRETKEVLDRRNIVAEDDLRSACGHVGTLHEERVREVCGAQNGAQSCILELESRRGKAVNELCY